MVEQLAALKIDLNNEINGHSATKRKIVNRLRTVLKANSRDKKQVVDYMLKELIKELEEG